MVRSFTLVVSVIIFQLGLALYFMIQCYDGNFFSSPKNKFKTSIDKEHYKDSNQKINRNLNEKMQKPNFEKCETYAQKCFGLFEQLKNTKRDQKLRLKPFNLVKANILDIWRSSNLASDSSSSPNKQSSFSSTNFRQIMLSFSQFIQNKKIITLPRSKDDFSLESIAIEMNASKVLRLNHNEHMLFQDQANIEWLSLNEYLSYLIDFQSYEQYDNAVCAYLSRNVDPQFLLNMIHCMIKVDGLFFLNLNQNWFNLITKLNGWLDVSIESKLMNDFKHTNASNQTESTSSPAVSEHKIFTLKKKTLCDL